MFAASNIHYEMSARTKAVPCGGIGAILLMVRKLGLIDEIDRDLHLLKVHLPYHESDHVLNIAFNALSGGRSLEDLELLRNDENYLNALGAQRIPDPTTAGDFCRRHNAQDVVTLMECFNRIRQRVWGMQTEFFFEEAVLDMDSSVLETLGECKEGMDISYKGVWGYHPLMISLANTREPLYLVNRSGNRPSAEGGAEYVDRAIELVRSAGFRDVTLRGDTAFSQTEHLDGWDARDVRFVFGYDAMPKLVRIAEDLPNAAWERLQRPEKYKVETMHRARPENVKERIVREREFKNLTLHGEHVAEFDYKPVACKKPYRIVVLRKLITEEQGEALLLAEHRYLFYITNDRLTPAPFIVFDANQRCDQENILSELKTGVRALHAPVNTLVANWAYMVMASLAWSLKAWFGLLLPEDGRWAEKHTVEKEQVCRMSFLRFIRSFMLLPTQIVRQGRKLIYRILTWNQYLPIFFRALDRIRGIPQLC